MINISLSMHGSPLLCPRPSYLSCVLQPSLESSVTLLLPIVLSQHLTGALLTFSMYYADYFTMKIYNLERAYGSDSNCSLHLILM